MVGGTIASLSGFQAGWYRLAIDPITVVGSVPAIQVAVSIGGNDTYQFTIPATSADGGQTSATGSSTQYFDLYVPESLSGTIAVSFNIQSVDASGNNPAPVCVNSYGVRIQQLSGIQVNTYDYLNRLVKVRQYTVDSSGTALLVRPTDGATVNAEPNDTTTYIYDVFGNRIAESVTDNTVSPPATTKTWFVNDGTSIALELTQKPDQTCPTLSQVRLNGAAVDQVLVVHDLTTPASDQVYWLLANRQNTVLDEETLPPGSPSSTSPSDIRVGFDTFGKPLASNPFVPVVIYAGQECDLTTKLNYDQARFYNPSMQRFMNPDPLGLVADTNEYRYCGNSPMNATDPSGEFLNVAIGAGNWRSIRWWGLST